MGKNSRYEGEPTWQNTYSHCLIFYSIFFPPMTFTWSAKQAPSGWAGSEGLGLGLTLRLGLGLTLTLTSGWAGSEGLGWFRGSLCPQVGLVQKVIVPSGLVVVEGRCRRLLLFVQDYEEKLRCLQAECSAEQQSRALLQEHMASLRRAYHGQLASRVQSGASRGRCSPAHGEAAWICYVKRIIIKHNLFTMLGASVCCALGLVIQALSRCFHPQRSSRGRA